jgi:hypothetical protein
MGHSQGEDACLYPANGPGTPHQHIGGTRMGKLRTAIQGIVKSLNTNATKVSELEKHVKDKKEHLTGVAQTAYEGFDVITLYLTAKFKKQGAKLEDHKNKKLKDKDVWDSELDKQVKGVQSWAKSLLDSQRKVASEFSSKVGDISKTLDDAAGDIAAAKKIADKKRAKWLTSKEYKAKINTYLGVLAGLETMVKQQRTSINKAAAMASGEQWIQKNFTLTLDDTVGNVAGMASMSLNGLMKEYLKNSNELDAYVRTLRDEYKGIAGQLATMKKWSDDADAMDELTDL